MAGEAFPAALVAGAFAGPAGVATLRLAWAQPRRSLPRNLAGWALIVAGAGLGAAAAGMWGLSVVALCAMACACLLLAHAALNAPPAKLRASNRRTSLAPEGGGRLRLGGRLLTFALVALVAPLCSLGIAVALAWIALQAGLGATDAYALALFALPLIWALLCYLLLMRAGRAQQMKLLALASIPGWPFLASGVLA